MGHTYPLSGYRRYQIITGCVTSNTGGQSRWCEKEELTVNSSCLAPRRWRRAQEGQDSQEIGLLRMQVRRFRRREYYIGGRKACDAGDDPVETDVGLLVDAGYFSEHVRQSTSV